MTRSPGDSSVYDAKTHKLVKQIQVGQYSAAISFTPDSKRAYVCIAGANAVAVIDMTSLSFVTQIPVGRHGVSGVEVEPTVFPGVDEPVPA